MRSVCVVVWCDGYGHMCLFAFPVLEPPCPLGLFTFGLLVFGVIAVLRGGRRFTDLRCLIFVFSYCISSDVVESTAYYMENELSRIMNNRRS